MKFKLDTNYCEKIKLEITESDKEDELTSVIQEFCFGIASFYIDFAMKLNCDTQKAKSLQDVCISCINRNIETILAQGVLEQAYQDDTLQDEESRLIDQLHDRGFSEDEIFDIIKFVKSSGSIEEATEILRKIGNDAGIDMDKEIRIFKSQR